MKVPSSRSGFSLIEIIFVVAILAIIMAAVFELLLASNRNYDSAMALQDAMVQNQRALRTMERELFNAQVTDSGFQGVGGTGAAADHLFIEFQVPVEQDDGTGTMLPVTVNGSQITVNWGANTRQGGLLDHFVRYQFVTDETLSEASEDVDFNADGDKADSILRGHIVRQVFAQPASAGARTPVEERILTPSWVYVRDPSDTETQGAGRVSGFDGPDADEADDPLFRIADATGEPNATGQRILLSLVMGRRNGKRFERVMRNRLITPISAGVSD